MFEVQHIKEKDKVMDVYKSQSQSTMKLLALHC